MLKIYRGYLLLFGEYQIYFMECGEKLVFSIFHEYIALVKMLVFSPHEMKFIWYLPKNVNFYFILYSKENYRKQNATYFLKLTSQHA